LIICKLLTALKNSTATAQVAWGLLCVHKQALACRNKPSVKPRTHNVNGIEEAVLSQQASGASQSLGQARVGRSVTLTIPRGSSTKPLAHVASFLAALDFLPLVCAMGCKTRFAAYPHKARHGEMDFADLPAATCGQITTRWPVGVQ
jgi:hypothetical protein